METRVGVPESGRCSSMFVSARDPSACPVTRSLRSALVRSSRLSVPTSRKLLPEPAAGRALLVGAASTRSMEFQMLATAQIIEPT